MLFVLSGPSYVGKKTSIYHFVKLYSFSSIIPYTTKPTKRREGEIEGIQYHYVEPVNARDIKNNDFIWDNPFDYGAEYQDDAIYAYKKTDIESAILSYANFIIHASVTNAMNIYRAYHEKYGNQLYVIFLDFSSALTEDFFCKKFPGKVTEENIDDFERRFTHAQKERNLYLEHTELFDQCLKSDKPYDIFELLELYVLPKLMVMPTSPDRIPGPLSDADIIYMAKYRKSDKLEVELDSGRP